MMGIDESRARHSRCCVSLAGVTLALMVAGCKDKVPTISAEPPPMPPPIVTLNIPAPALPTPGLSPRARLSRVVDLLQQGDEAQAKAELTELLHQRPSMREAKELQQAFDTDPKAELGAESFAYHLGPRESLISVAIGFFGDSYKFYALARYNGIAVPNSVKPGDVIQIPGRRRAPVYRHQVRQADDESRPDETVATPAPEAPRTNPAQAQKLRRAGLERMSAGSIDQAVSLLEQAQRLDPANGAIAGDLGRARRVQAVVHNRH